MPLYLEKILSKKTYIIAIVIPNAKLIPIPPLRLTDDTETAINVKMKTATGKLNFLYLTTSYLPISEDPLCFFFFFIFFI